MTALIDIAGDSGALIRIEVHGYEDAGAGAGDDANWLTCSLTVSVDGAVVERLAALEADGLHSLKEALTRVLESMDGTASFSALEQALGFKVTVKPTGRGVVQGTARSGAQMATLSFSFETDQTFLSRALRQLTSVLSEFPAR